MSRFLRKEVKLKESENYDSETTITPNDVGEITDVLHDGDNTRYVISFQELIDSEGVTPQVFKLWGEFTFIPGQN